MMEMKLRMLPRCQKTQLIIGSCSQVRSMLISQKDLNVHTGPVNDFDPELDDGLQSNV